MGFPDEFWIGFVIMVGIFLKLVYDIQAGYISPDGLTGLWRSQRGAAPGSGTLGVIQYYYNHHALPDFSPRTYAGYAAPPLYPILAALFLWLITGVMGWKIAFGLYLLSCVNVIFVTAGIFAGIGLLSKFGVKGRRMVVSILFLTFFPGYYHLGSVIGPDALLFMLLMLSLNSAANWYLTRQARTMKRLTITLCLAFLTGYRTFLILPPILLIILYAARDGRVYHVPLPLQFRRFAIPCGIAAFLWPVYNLLRFGLPLFYTDPAPNDWSTSYASLSPGTRLGIPSLHQLLHLRHTGKLSLSANIWAQALKSAVVDYTSLNLTLVPTRRLAGIIVLLCLVLFICGIGCAALYLPTSGMAPAFKAFYLSGVISLIGGYLLWNLIRPCALSATFRLLPELPVLLLMGQGFAERDGWQSHPRRQTAGRLCSWGMFASAVLTAVLFGFFAA